MVRKAILLLALGAALPGCMDAYGPPPGASTQACFAQDETPATFETVSRTVRVAPARRDAAGRILEPARYETRHEQRQIGAREPIRFRTPCAADLTPGFVSSLQRALAARQLYAGPIDGQMTAPLRQAIRAYQEKLGIQSDTLSLDAAQRLGLVRLTPEQLSAAGEGWGNPFWETPTQ